MKLKIALTPLVDITAEDCLALIAMGKVRANKFEGQRKREVYTQGNYTGTLKVDVTTATLLLTVIAPALAFIPRSGHLEDTPFWYGSKQEVDYTPAINGTSWIYIDQIKAMPALRTEVPMLSAGNGMQAIFADGDITLDFVGYKNNFGNLWWASTDGKYACSWNGPYSRLFTDVYRNTVGNEIYILGELITGPEYEDFNVVLGASYPEEQLYAITYHSPVVGKQAVSKYVNGEWIKLGDLESSYSKQAWFADSTGLVFTHPRGHKVTISGDTITEVVYTPPTGSQNETYVTGSMPTFTKEYEGASLFEGNVVGNLTLTQNISTANTGSSSSTSAEFDVEGVVTTIDTGGIIGPEWIAVGATYELQYGGTRCSIIWSVSGCTYETYANEGGIKILAITGCGTGSITATIVGGGNDGQSFTKEIKYPSGTWIFISNTWLNGNAPNLGCTAWPPGPPVYCVMITGGGAQRDYYMYGYPCTPCQNYPNACDGVTPPTNGRDNCMTAPPCGEDSNYGFNGGCYADPGYTGTVEYNYNYSYTAVISRNGICRYCYATYEWRCS